MLKKMRKQRGQSIVEWAIILPFLLLVLFSIIELAPIMNTFVKIEKAAQYGARTGAIHGTTNAEIAQAIQYNLQGLVVSGNLRSSGTIDVPSSDGVNRAATYTEMANGYERTYIEIVPGDISNRINGGWVMVRITYRYPVITPMLKTVLKATDTMPDGKNFDITRYAIYRIE